jgi:hypothetical protein
VAQGLQIFDASGNLILDLGDATGRFLGSIDTGNVDGSTTNAALTSGTPFAVVLLKSGSTFGFKTPDVTFSGTTMSWTYDGATSKNDATILFGVV